MASKANKSAAQKARERAKAEREAAAAKARRQKSIATVVIAAVVVALVAGMGGLVWWQKHKESQPGIAPTSVVAPYPNAAVSTPDGFEPETTNTAPGMRQGVGIGSADAPVTVELFEDFSCPHCQELERAGLSQVLQTYLADDSIRVVFYPMSLPMFGRPSELAANAFACASDAGKAEEFHDILYRDGVWNQQWTNSTLLDAAEQVGLEGGDFSSCVKDGTFEDWSASIDDYATLRGVTGTPTVFVNGTKVGDEDMTPDGIQLQIGKALEK